jgi:hypothetical protein
MLARRLLGAILFAALETPLMSGTRPRHKRRLLTGPSQGTASMPVVPRIQHPSEGLERAKARGVTLGRKPKLTPEERRESVWEIARGYNVNPSTIFRLAA